jgi:muramoyltetrapeptide carboxypeptidase
MQRLSDFHMPRLAPGERVRLVAPSGPFERADFERGVERLRGQYDVQYDPSILERSGYLAGSDERRLRELQAALDDPDCAGILAARGGYGSTRILAGLELTGLRARPKLLVGFSDITALHALWARERIGSVHAGMVAALGRADDAQCERYLRALAGHFPERWSGLRAIRPGRAEGVLLGGNLTVLSALLGTPHFPPLQDAVLFLEDVGERPYRIDRMLTSWQLAGAFEHVRAIVLGAFVQSDAGPDGVTAEDVLAERLGSLGIPVAAGLSAGHIDDNVELPFGARVALDTVAGELIDTRGGARHA